ncbi:MAG: hypothetical protein ACM3KR_11200 [Deltaproteobacteria bacterium]
MKSLLNIKSLGVLSAVLIGYFFSKWEPLIVIGFLSYTAVVGALLMSPEFRENCIIQDKISKIKRLNHKSTNLYFRAKSKVGKNLTAKIIEKIFSILGKSRFIDVESRVDAVYRAKAEIIDTFLSKDYSPIRQKVALKSLELSIVYFRLMDIYISRLFDVSSRNLAAIEQRIGINRRKKIAAGNKGYINDLERAIEADERLLERLKEARKEVENMSVKLNLIESTMALLKQQVYTEFSSEEMLENVENTINEAQALESALSQHSTMKRKNYA